MSLILYISGLGVGPGKRKSADYYMELLNNVLSTTIGKNFTLESISTTANALAYLYTLKKAVEDEIRGKFTRSPYVSVSVNVSVKALTNRAPSIT